MKTLHKLRRRVILALPILILVAALPSSGINRAPGEKVISFTGDVTVREDSSIQVREEILVHSEATYFKWGMVRHLPISATERWDKRFAGEWRDDTGIRVKILGVTQDGSPVQYEQGSGAGYGQLRIGASNVPLARGDRTFVITYVAEGVLKPLPDRDELYWNALGFYLDLPVEASTIHVHLPPGVPSDAIRTGAYVGRRGAIEPVDSAPPDGSTGTVIYQATNLPPAESLSVEVNWPNGFIARPKMGIFERGKWLLAAPVVFFLYYLVVWMSLGRDPALGSVPVRYAPPEGLSPAAVRYIRTTGTDARTMAAVIAQLAARECIEIEFADGKYKLTQLKSGANVLSNLAPEEARVLEMLFEDGNEIILHPNKGDELNKYSLAIQGQLQKRLDGVYFTRHAGYILLGMFFSLLTAMGMAFTAAGRDTTGLLFLTWWLFFCGSTLGAIFLFSVIPACKLALRGMGGTIQVLIGLGVMAAFGSVFVMLLRMMAKNISPMYAIALVALIAVNVGWIPALKRMTARGREALVQIAGFRMFLEKVEQDRMHRLNAKDEPPTASVEFLPYAIALEVRESWGDHLAGAFYAATTSR